MRCIKLKQTGFCGDVVWILLFIFILYVSRQYLYMQINSVRTRNCVSNSNLKILWQCKYEFYKNNVCKYITAIFHTMINVYLSVLLSFPSLCHISKKHELLPDFKNRNLILISLIKEHKTLCHLILFDKMKKKYTHKIISISLRAPWYDYSALNVLFATQFCSVTTEKQTVTFIKSFCTFVFNNFIFVNVNFLIIVV